MAGSYGSPIVSRDWESVGKWWFSSIDHILMFHITLIYYWNIWLYFGKMFYKWPFVMIPCGFNGIHK
jgi:hypothetical protein